MYVVKAEDHSSIEQAILDAVEHVLHYKSFAAKVTEKNVDRVNVSVDLNQITIQFQYAAPGKQARSKTGTAPAKGIFAPA